MGIFLTLGFQQIQNAYQGLDFCPHILFDFLEIVSWHNLVMVSWPVGHVPRLLPAFGGAANDGEAENQEELQLHVGAGFMGSFKLVLGGFLVGL